MTFGASKRAVSLLFRATFILNWSCAVWMYCGHVWMYCGHVKHLFLLQGIFPACYIHLKEAAVEGSGFVPHVYSQRPSSSLISFLPHSSDCCHCWANFGLFVFSAVSSSAQCWTIFVDYLISLVLHTNQTFQRQGFITYQAMCNI